MSEESTTIVQITEPEHKEKLLEFILEMKVQNFPDVTFTEEQQNRFREITRERIDKVMQTPYYTGFLLKVGDEYVSTCSISLFYSCRQAQKSYYIHGLHTMPKHQGKGYRKQLIDYVINTHAPENSVQGFTCQLHEMNLIGQELFEEFDFEPTCSNEFTLLYDILEESEEDYSNRCKEMARKDKLEFVQRLDEMKIKIPERPNFRFEEIHLRKDFEKKVGALCEGNIFNILDYTSEYMIDTDSLKHSFPVKSVFPELFRFFLMYEGETIVGCFFASSNLHITNCNFRMFLRDIWVKKEYYKYKNFYLREVLNLIMETEILDKGRFWHLFICKTFDEDVLNMLNAFKALDKGYDTWERYPDEEHTDEVGVLED